MLWPILDYKPSPKQEAFFRSNHRRRLLRCGNQVGKTLTACHEAWAHALGAHPYKEVPTGPSTGLIVCADWRSYVDVISKTMYATAPKMFLSPDTEYSVERGWKNRMIKLRNGSVIYFRSAEQGPTAIAGLVCDWLLIDEPPPQDIFSEALTRIAVRGGPVWMSFTPIGRPVEWLRDHVEGTESEPAREDWEQYRIGLTVEDCPHRTQESINVQLASYLPSEMPQRARGEWEGSVTEREMECFELDLIKDIELKDLGRCYLGLSLDHGEKKSRQTAILIAWNKDFTVVLDEYVSESATNIDDDSRAILELLQRNKVGITELDLAVGDINSAGKLARGTTVNQELSHRLGIQIQKAYKRKVSDHVYDMNQAFLNKKLFVHSRCKNLTKSLLNWKHEPQYEYLKHMIDAAHYICPRVYNDYHKLKTKSTYVELV